PAGNRHFPTRLAWVSSAGRSPPAARSIGLSHAATEVTRLIFPRKLGVIPEPPHVGCHSFGSPSAQLTAAPLLPGAQHAVWLVQMGATGHKFVGCHGVEFEHFVMTRYDQSG